MNVICSLAQPSVVSDLLTYAIAETTDQDPKIQYKYPFVACEVLSSELTAYALAIMQVCVLRTVSSQRM